MIAYDEKYKVYKPQHLNTSSFISAFGTKSLKATKENKSLLQYLESNEISYKKIFRLNQIHSTTIKVITNDNLDMGDGDGIITNISGVAIAVQTADCVPIVFLDKETGTIGVSHNGWKGSLNNFVQKMINKFVEQGSNKNNIYVAIGPAIGMCCFEVKDDVYVQFEKRMQNVFSEISLERNNKKYLNLLRLNYLLLKKAGLAASQIEYFPFCTNCDTEKFFSYRRDYRTNYPMFGEQLSFIIKR